MLGPHGLVNECVFRAQKSCRLYCREIMKRLALAACSRRASSHGGRNFVLTLGVVLFSVWPDTST